MTKKFKEPTNWYMVFAIIFFVVIAVFACIETSREIFTQMEYCQDNGWDGLYDGRWGDSDTCYKDVPHESGIGTTREYSGDLR